MVIHLAARTDLDDTRIEGYAANIDGVRNLLSAIRATSSVRRAVFTSSQLVCRPGFVPKTAQEYSPHTLYGESKVLTEKIVREGHGGGVDWCLVRPTTVWGPHMGPHYQRMLELVRRGRYFHCGKGRMLKSYSYVGNIAAQYSALLEAPASAICGGTFYLADYIPLSLRDYADELAKAMNAPSIPTLPLPVARALAHIGDVLNGVGWRAFPFNSFRLKNILTEYVFDLRPTSDVCGPLPYTFREGVEATGKWFMDLKKSKVSSPINGKTAAIYQAKHKTSLASYQKGATE
jgi:nucleoside-diphosphate-sugar epimerase